MGPEVGKFVTVMPCMAGFMAVLFWYNEEDGGFWEPYETSIPRFLNREAAAEYGRQWAIAEGCAFR